MQDVLSEPPDPSYNDELCECCHALRSPIVLTLSADFQRDPRGDDGLLVLSDLEEEGDSEAEDYQEVEDIPEPPASGMAFPELTSEPPKKPSQEKGNKATEKAVQDHKEGKVAGLEDQESPSQKDALRRGQPGKQTARMQAQAPAVQRAPQSQVARVLNADPTWSNSLPDASQLFRILPEWPPPEPTEAEQIAERIVAGRLINFDHPGPEARLTPSTTSPVLIRPCSAPQKQCTLPLGLCTPTTRNQRNPAHTGTSCMKVWCVLV